MHDKNDIFPDLMRRTLAGDTGAYAQLLRQSTQLLRPFLARYLHGNSESDDVLQEILLSLHKAKHTYDGNRPYRPWLFAIAKFRLKDYLRRHYGDRLRQAVDITDVENFLSSDVTESPSSHELLDESLKNLHGKQAKIIELLHSDGYTAKEVGEKLNMKESAVKVAAHRAYKILREKLGK